MTTSIDPALAPAEAVQAQPAAAFRADPVLPVAAVMLAGALSMGLEILGSRLLAPDFGQSLYTWGALISVVLVALAVGYAAGGMASRRHARAAAVGLPLMIGGVWMAVLPFVASPVTERLADLGDRVGALAASGALFAVPVASFAFVAPCCIRMLVRDARDAGLWAGLLSALSTAGSVAGTLGTSFWLIESFSVRHTLLVGGLAGVGAGLVLLVADARAVRARGAAPAQA